MGRKSGSPFNARDLNKIAIDLPATVDANFSSALRTYLVEQVTASWNFWFGLLEEFVGREGHSRVSNEFRTSSGYRLGQWVSSQRKAEPRMLPERKERLEALQGWSWDALQEKMEEGFYHLNEFVSQEGHAIVPVNFKATDGYRLGQWVSIQRQNVDSMSPERKARLERLPSWSWDAVTAMWEEGFRHIKEFVGREGHCLVPAQYKTADGYPVGNWVSKQRRNKDIMKSEMKARLEALPGWEWDPFSIRWEEGFKHLKEYSELNGHAKVLNNFKTADGYSLGQWVLTQRKNKDKISLERKVRLETLPGWSWNTLLDSWEDGFRHLKEFTDREGVAKPLYNHNSLDGFRLGQWVTVQRTSRNNLSSERKSRLEELPGWCWDVVSDMWEDGFRHLKEFAEREGHCLVPALYKAGDGYRIGAWVSTQRQTRDKMSPEHIARLEALPSWVWRVK